MANHKSAEKSYNMSSLLPLVSLGRYQSAVKLTAIDDVNYNCHCTIKCAYPRQKACIRH